MCRSRRSSRISSIRIWSPSGSSTYRSGCVRALDARGRRRAARRRTRSPRAACRPRPGRGRGTRAPAPRRARPRGGAWPPPAQESSRSVHRDLLGDLARPAACRRRRDPLREQLGELAVGGVDAALELVASRSIRSPLGADAARAPRRVEQRAGTSGRAAGRRVACRFSSSTRSTPEPARDALVGERRVEVAVADHVGAAREGRADHLVDELRARRGEERGLGPRRDVALGRAAASRTRSPSSRPARLARRDDVAAVARERLGEQFGLRRLAGAVDSFERDEHPRPRIRAGAGDRHRGRGVHRLARGRGAARARRRGDVVDDLSTGKRENVPDGARLVERDIRAGARRRLRRRPAGGRASTSPPRPTCASRSSGPSSTPR